MTSTVTFPRSEDVHILIVDDDESIRRSLQRLLSGVGYHCAAVADSEQARRALAVQHFDLMVCDVTMPGESGVSLLARVRQSYPDLAVIMVTALDSPHTAGPAARLGAYASIVKPFDTNMVLINVVGALRQRADGLAARALAARSDPDLAAREAEVRDLLGELLAEDAAGSPARAETVRRIAVAAEWREHGVAEHLEHVSRDSARLGTLAGLSSEEVETLRSASQLHDVGKVTVPDAIARKAKLLTEGERLVMQGHTETGFKMLEGSESPILRMAAVIALSHHERFDGNGYPHRLTGDAIPLEGRIVAVADVFDALRSTRPYKKAYSQVEALEIFRHRRRAQLDPELLDLFINDLESRRVSS